MMKKPVHRRVSREQFLLEAEGASRMPAFPPSGPEYYLKDQRHYGYQNLSTGEFVIFDWSNQASLF